MGINVKAKQTKIQVGEQKGTYRFVLQADTYNTLSVKKVLQSATRSPADNKALFLTAVRLIQEGRLQVGQLIDEHEYQWIHISLPTSRIRYQILHLP